MEQNSKSANERSRRKPFISVLVAVLVAALAAFVATPLMSNEKVYAAELTVDSGLWTDLEDKIREAQDGDTIKITKDIIAKDGTINISGKKIKIQGEGNNVTIWRDKDNANFSMFTVGAGGDLTLGDNLTLSGQTGTCEDDDEPEGNFTVIWKDGSGTHSETWSTDGEVGNYHPVRGQELEGPGRGSENSWAPEGYTFAGWKVEGIDLSSEDSNGTVDPSYSKVLDKIKVPDTTNGTVTVVATWDPVKSEKGANSVNLTPGTNNRAPYALRTGGTGDPVTFNGYNLV